MSKMNGIVLQTNKDKCVVKAGNEFYLLTNVNKKVDEKIEFDSSDALIMPSFMFAIAALNEEDLSNTLDFIQSKWFSKK